MLRVLNTLAIFLPADREACIPQEGELRPGRPGQVCRVPGVQKGREARAGHETRRLLPTHRAQSQRRVPEEQILVKPL